MTRLVVQQQQRISTPGGSTQTKPRVTEGQQQHEVHICGECGSSPEVIAVRLCGALTCQSADCEGIYLQLLIVA